MTEKKKDEPKQGVIIPPEMAPGESVKMKGITIGRMSETEKDRKERLGDLYDSMDNSDAAVNARNIENLQIIVRQNREHIYIHCKELWGQFFMILAIIFFFLLLPPRE